MMVAFGVHMALITMNGGLFENEAVMSVTDFMEMDETKPNETYNLYGTVATNSLVFNIKSNNYKFDYTDFKNTVHITWVNGGSKYEFKEGESLVLFGYYRKEKTAFIATDIVTNHSLEAENWEAKSNIKNNNL